jgi:hypothetical protein
MSQQINLLLPELRPRFDWLALPVVLGAALLGLLLLVVIAGEERMRLGRLAADEANINGQLLNLQQQVQSLGQALSARQASAALPQQIEAAKAATDQRREVLAYVSQGDPAKGAGFGSMMEGFARQSVEGAWLVGFGFSQQGVEIRGRLIDPALLPVYIGKLNGDAAFNGRRFAALEMLGVDPVAEKVEDGKHAPRPAARYTEFALRSELAPSPGKAP